MKKKHKITLLVIGILLALSLMLSSSYALWVFNVSQKSTNVLVSDCFEITLTDNNPIGLGASFPMRDSDGVKTTPYTFTIKNICNHPADFQINLETLNSSTIDEEFIKADLNGHITGYNAAESAEPTIEGAKNAVKLYEDTLAVNSSKTYKLRIWVNENATQEDVENKSYASKISVKATVRKQYAEGTLVSGSNFNVALKILADGGNPEYYTDNTSITSIEWSNTAPQESDDAVNLAVEGTTTPIYAWFKDGTIYINSVLDKIYMNDNSSLMFYEMQGVTSLDLSHFDTSKVTYMSNMFSGMSGLTSLDVSHFDTSNVENMSDMFNRLENIGELDVSHFDTSNVTGMSSMFNGMRNLINLDLSNFDTSKVTDMSYMFQGLKNISTLDVSHFDTSKVTDMRTMFYGMSNLTSLDVSNFDTSNVTTMSSMFEGMSSLTSLEVSNFNTSNVTNMRSMFYGMSNLTSLDVSHFDTSKVTNMYQMFSGMSKLTSLDVSHFDTSNVTDMYQMFYGMNSLTSLDVSNFDTSNVINMSQMFSVSSGSISRCYSSLRYIDGLNSFNTSKVTDMSSMFFGSCTLTEIDLSSFDTSKVTDMENMFDFMRSVNKIYVGNNWSTANLTSTSAQNYTVFVNCHNIVGGAGTTYDANHTDAEYARVDDPANGKPGYLTYKSA